jgi:hypothetical protein
MPLACPNCGHPLREEQVKRLGDTRQNEWYREGYCSYVCYVKRQLCPNCGSVNPQSSVKCGCGYELATVPAKESKPEPELPATSFCCSIPDRALTGYEQVAVGMTTGGAFRGMFRPARAFFENAAVVVHAQTDPVAGGSEVIAAKIPLKGITEVRFSSVSTNEQVNAALSRGVVVGGGFALVIIVMAMLATARNPSRSVNFGVVIAVAILGGLAIGFFFSFLPSLAELRRDLIQILLMTPDNKALMLFIGTAEKEAVAHMFSARGLKVRDIEQEQQIKYGTEIAKCEWCRASIGNHHPESLCTNCGHSLPQEVLALLSSSRANSSTTPDDSRTPKAP